MVSFWPWRKEDSSPASFEKTLSALSTKITATQAQLDKTRSSSRRFRVLTTLYLGFAYLVYAIVLILVVGWKHMGAVEWTGLAGGPVLIYVVRTVSTAVFDYRINRLTARLKALQADRNKTIQKLKDATKYDTTLQLLEKYGGSDGKPKKGKKTEDDEGAEENKKNMPVKRTGTHGRTNMPPPPTANIQRPPISAPGTPQPRPHGALGTPLQPSPQPEMDASAEFAPNAFDGRGPPPAMQHHPAAMAVAPATPESHWYDRILDTLLGEDETAAKNRIVLICAKCRLVNGQAPPGTKSLAELGMWKCMACGANNGEVDEGKRIMREVLGDRKIKEEATDDDGDENSSDVVEVEKDDTERSEGERPKKGGNAKRRG